MNLDIKKMDKEDEEELKDVESLIKTYKDDFVVWDNYYDAGVQMDFFWNYKTDQTIVAKEDNEVIGFLCYQPESDRTDIPSEEPFTYLSLILVDGEYRGEGIGSKMIGSLLERLQNETINNPIVFGTWESNSAQISLAKKFGFELFDIKKNHRHNGESSLYYRKFV